MRRGQGTVLQGRGSSGLQWPGSGLFCTLHSSALHCACALCKAVQGGSSGQLTLDTLNWSVCGGVHIIDLSRVRRQCSSKPLSLPAPLGGRTLPCRFPIRRQPLHSSGEENLCPGVTVSAPGGSVRQYFSRLRANYLKPNTRQCPL